MTFNEASEYVKSQEVPEEISCLKSDTFYHEYYYSQGDSIVSEVKQKLQNLNRGSSDCLIFSGISSVKTVSGEQPYR